MSAVLLRRQSSGQVANIYRNGERIESIDLGKVTSTYSFTLTDDNGHENQVEVAPGRIRIASANCPDQICVQTGWIENSIQPIVCLPAKLTIRLEKTDDSENPFNIDGVAG